MNTLYEQALAKGLAFGGAAGRLDFFSLAHRARNRSESPERLFAWFIRNIETSRKWISDSDEAAARSWINHEALRESQQDRKAQRTQRVPDSSPAQGIVEMSDEAKMVGAFRRASYSQPAHDPFDFAQARGWTRDRWDAANAEWESHEKRRLAIVYAKHQPQYQQEHGARMWSRGTEPDPLKDDYIPF